VKSILAALLLGLSLLFQTACGSFGQAPASETKAGEAKAGESKPDQAQAPASGPFVVPQDQLARLKIAPVQRTTWSIAINTTGTVDWDADHTTQAITQVNGPISRILVDTGARVQANDPLLYVSSPDVANAITAYRKARNREEFNRKIVERQKMMLDHGAIAVKDYESNVADYNDAMTDVQNSLQALKIFGHTKDEIEAAEQQGKGISPELAVRSPIAGIVVQKLISPGMVIQAGNTVCFMLSDVSKVWVQGHIFDHDLPNIRPGDAVEETNPAFDRHFRGAISFIGAFVDPTTRTTPVRIVTENPQGLLKKDMFVNAVIHTGVQKNTLAVPVSAVLRDAQNEPIVYVEVETGKFAQRSVKIGAQQNNLVEILSGLQEGEKVVSEGGLFLQFANSYQ
jgi:cobalt-zinc-cadmium efflux system membrane fusion protein